MRTNKLIDLFFLPQKRTFFVVFGLIMVLAYLIIQAQEKNDFLIFISAVDALFHHQDIYTIKYVDGYHYYYSVFFALLISPLKFLPLSVGLFIWLLGNVFFLARTVKILWKWLQVKTLTNVQKIIWMCVVVASMFYFIHGNFHTGQMTIFMLYTMLEGVWQIKKGRNIRGALLLGLAINIKLLPLVIIPYLLYQEWFKASLYTITVLALFYALPYLLIDASYYSSLLESWWGLINPLNQEHVMDIDERSFHGLSTLMATLLSAEAYGMYDLNIKRHLLDLPQESIKKVLLGIRLLFIGFFLFFLKIRPFQKTTNDTKILWELSYLVLIIPLIFPHQQHYAFYLSLPAIAYLIHFFVSQQSYRNGKFYVFVTCLIVMNLSFFFGFASAYFIHFKTLTYGTILLIVPLYLCKPIALKLNYE